MKKVVLILVLLFCIFSAPVYAFKFKKTDDVRKKQAKYVQKVLKEDEKEKYERRVTDYKQSGFMTVEEYKKLSEYKDKSEINFEIPKMVQSSDMKYVPKPIYRIERYNYPPGSPELNITNNFYKFRQYNGKYLVAPDLSIVVYPVVYYYADSVSTASDIFVIPILGKGSPLSKILSVNIANRLPNPIISTDKSIDDSYSFRTLTPIDFSPDSKKVLVKEKLGSSIDGIWKTNVIVYDFTTNTSYNLLELRDAIVYYWKENKKLNLDDYRWDIFPVGFSNDDANRIVAYSYAYTGDKPVFLGVWSIDIHGEQSRLISFNIDDVSVSINGLKVVQDGVTKPIIVTREQKHQKKIDKKAVKYAKKIKKAAYKEFKKEYKEKIKEMNSEYRDSDSDFKLLQKVEGSTTMNDIQSEYENLKIKKLQEEIKKQESIIQKEQQELQKLNVDLNSINDVQE